MPEITGVYVVRMCIGIIRVGPASFVFAELPKPILLFIIVNIVETVDL
jgi:hypothetical protein